MHNVIIGVSPSPRKIDQATVALEQLARAFQAESFAITRGKTTWVLRISYSTKKLAREVYNEIDEDFFTTAIHKDFLEEHPEFKAFKPRFMFVEDEGYAMVVSR